MKKLIIANWKMYPKTLKEARLKFAAIKKKAGVLRDVQTVVCAPFPFMGDLARSVAGHRCVLGAQNVWVHDEGAFTGEVSPFMLGSLKVFHVIVGHSERRALGETDELINKKTVAAVKAGLMAVVCVGETVRDPDGAYMKLISDQIVAALRGISKKDIARIAIAYEPIWAIGVNALRAASPDDALEVSIQIRKTLAGLYGQESFTIPILYGGSVDAHNTGDFLSKSQVQGLLVGRASLDPDVFGGILQSAARAK